MSATEIALLGAIAGLTIFLGLPIGRLRNPAPRVRALLNAGAVGILLFLLWDVLAHAWEPLDAALGKHHYGSGCTTPPKASASSPRSPPPAPAPPGATWDYSGSSAAVPPSWAPWSANGSPTVSVSITFLALAAGSILYVVIELLAVGRRMATKEITTWGLVAGLLLPVSGLHRPRCYW